MPENVGVAPLHPTTNVGKTRLTIGDTVATNIAGGFGEYSYFSDDEITQFLTAGGDNPMRAVGWAYLAWAGQAAAESIAIADFDLKADYSKRAGELRATAQMYFGMADDADVISGGAEEFLIGDTGTDAVSSRAEAVAYNYPLWNF